MSGRSVRHWLRDRHLRSILRNSSYLAISKAVAAPASLLTLALAGRSLGLVAFGTLVLINSYVKAAGSLAKFQSWQVVVRYGGRPLEASGTGQFRSAIDFALGLDVLGSVIALTAAGALVPLLAPAVGIPASHVAATLAYCTLLPLIVPATSVGVLRAIDRFDLAAWQGTATPMLRAILVAAAWAANARFEVFLAIWYLSLAGGALLGWLLAGRELARHGLLRGLRPTLRSTSLPGAWHFALNANVNSALGSASGSIARLLVGALLGPAGAALYRAASAITGAIAKPADLLAKAFYPEVVRMDASTRAPWRLMVRSAALAATVAIVAIVALIAFGKPFIGLVFGPRFGGGYQPLLVLALVPLIQTIACPMPWMLYALDRPQGPAAARLTCVGLYLSCIAPLTWAFGLIGAAAALVAGEAARLLVMSVMLGREYRRSSATWRSPGWC
ncbi:MAG: lipopolysaccharide biosynthesis protein [Sphingomicrobium sp.]